jgi:hypothetical protein
MDTGGSNRRAAFVEFLRTEEINAVVSCSLPNSVGQAGTHHSFWYSISRINASRPQMVTFFFCLQGWECHRRHVVVIELQAEIKEAAVVDGAFFYLTQSCD